MAHVHKFDPVSGWCALCNYREDGRLVGPGGQVYRPGPEYTPEQLHQLLTTTREKMNR